MRRHIHTVRDFVLPIIDFFYPPFRRMMSIQTFRYVASGGLNTLLSFAVYFISFKYIVHEEDLHLRFIVFKPHVAALFISFCFSFPFGFFLMKYVVFTDSNMKGRMQLLRYFMIYLFNLFINYLLLKVTVEVLHVYPILAQILTTIVIILFSYIAQRNFTFRIRDAEKDLTD